MGCRPQGQGAVRAIAGRFNELLEHVQSEQLGLFGIPGMSQSYGHKAGLHLD